MLRHLSLGCLGAISTLVCSTTVGLSQTPLIVDEPPAFPQLDLYPIPTNNSFLNQLDSGFSSPIGEPPSYQFQSPPPSSSIVPSAPFPPPNILDNPGFSSNTGASFNNYRVEVQGRSPSLLYAVKAVEPSAFVREMDGVIQAGVFSRADNAERRVIELKNQGIQSRVVRSEGGFNAIGQNSGVNNYVATLDSQDLRYVVVVPGNSSNLDLIVNRVRNAGISSSLIQSRSGPFGPNVAVGPFASREEADRWNAVVRALKLDSRVRYE